MANNKANGSSGFAYAYGWNVYYEKMLGMWTLNDEGLLTDQRIWAWAILIFLFIWLPQMASLSIMWGDLKVITGCLARNMTFSIALIKIMSLQYQKKVISSILLTIENDWKKVSTKENLNVMLETARISRIISIMSFSVTQVVFIELMTLQIFSGRIEQDPNNDPRLSYEFVHTVYIPFETSRHFIFVSMWIGQSLATILGGMSSAAFDSLVSMLVLHACGQLRIVRNSFKNLVDNTLMEETKQYWEKLAVIVKRHEQLNELAIVIRDTFSSVLLFQIMACSLAFCFQSFLMFTTLADRNDASNPYLELGFALIYAIYTLMHLFFQCYIGERLIVESTSLSDDYYEAEWYKLPPKAAIAFLLICQRSRSPLELKAGKFCTFNMELFNAVVKNSMGYFSMLAAMKDRIVD